MPVNTYGGLSTDTTLGGSNSSDVVIPSQKAIKTYVDNHSGGGSVAIDEKSITKNSSDEIQTVGVIDQANTSNAIKTWTGATADLPSTLDSNTIYHITDDTNPTQALLEAIYPVGSIYIGTMAICPLSALFGTWTLVGTKILTDVAGSNSVPVKGNGNTLVLSNGTGLYAFRGYSNVTYLDTKVGQPLGTTGVNNASVSPGDTLIGITTDESKSGIIADISSSLTKNELTVNIWQRSA